MNKIWTIIKAIWVFYQANKETIDKHILWIKAEIASLRAEKAIRESEEAQSALTQIDNTKPQE